jgi:hypothetical protein
LFELHLLLLKQMLDALDLPILQPKPAILIFQLNLFEVALVGLANHPIDLFHIIGLVLLVLRHSEKIAILREIPIDFLIEAFK